MVTLSACGGSSGGAAANKTIKVCTELPVSGSDTSAGKPAENGATLAVEQANTNNTLGAGYTLQVVHYDDVGASSVHDPTQGANNIRTAIGDAEIAGCVGPFNSSVAVAEMPIANQAPLALISPSNTGVVLTKPEGGQLGTLRPTGKVTYFRVSTTDDHQGPAGADYLYNTLHLKTVYIIDDTETYGKGIADAFQAEWTKLGGTVAGRKGLDKTTTDFKPALTQAAAAHVDAVYYGGTDANGGTLCRTQMAGISGLANTVYAGGDGLETDAFKTATLQANAGGAYVTVASVNADQLTTAQTFIQQFKARFTDPAAYGAYSANAYDAMNILIQSIKSAIAAGASAPTSSNDATGAAAFRQAVIDQIAKTNYSGVTGVTTFDSNGDTTNKIISIYQLTTDWTFKAQVVVQ
jgi:branched-chain amino acid transport system substrate-binding protein